MANLTEGRPDVQEVSSVTLHPYIYKQSGYQLLVFVCSDDHYFLYFALKEPQIILSFFIK